MDAACKQGGDKHGIGEFGETHADGMPHSTYVGRCGIDYIAAL